MPDPTFNTDVKPLFREKDRDAMLPRFDLWSFEDVKAHSPRILEALRAGSMPCDGRWSDANVQLFEYWTSSGMAE